MVVLALRGISINKCFMLLCLFVCLNDIGAFFAQFLTVGLVPSNYHAHDGGVKAKSVYQNTLLFGYAILLISTKANS